MTLLAIYFEAIYTDPWQAKKYIFTSLAAAKRIEVSSFLREIKNIAPTLLSPIVGSDLPPLITWKKGCSGLNLPRLASVGGYSTIFFD